MAKAKKGVLKSVVEICVGIIGFGIIAFYSNVLVAVGVIVLIELNNQMRGD